ncbi:MAG: hypothetical protein ACPGVY_12210, partial [Mycobacterium sp.]
GAGSSGLELVLQFEHDGQFFTPAASVGEMRPTWSTPPGATTPTRIVIPMAEVFGTPAVGVARLPVGKTEAARRVRVLARVAGTAGGTLKLEAVT